MKILVISSVFPNKHQPAKGIFIKQQLLELDKSCRIKVISPVPWFPPLRIFKKWHVFSQIDKKENIKGIEVYHPRYFLIPKIGRLFYGYFYFIGIFKTIRRITKTFSVDVILAYFAYPDGFAAALAAKMMNKPLVIKVLGSDINVFTKNRVRRYLTAVALKKANKIIAVSNELRTKIEKLGVKREKIEVVLNGVDIKRFKLSNQADCRNKLNLANNKQIILFVGNLKKEKGTDCLIEAFPKVIAKHKKANLIFVGEGEHRIELIRKIKSLNLESSVSLEGEKLHSEIPLWLAACDLVCLPSYNEGCPNIILEALACGKPVVATRVGAVPEIISSDEYGFLVDVNKKDDLAEAISKSLDKQWSQEKLRERVSGFTWAGTAEGIKNILEGVIPDNTHKRQLAVLYNHRTQGSGVEGVHISGICRALLKMGHSVDIVAPLNNNVKNDNKISRLSAKLPEILFELMEVIYNLFAMRKIGQRIRAKKYDFIYERYALLLWAGMISARRNKIPFILEVNYTAHTPLYRKRSKLLLPLSRIIENYIYKKTDAIFVVSNYLKEQLVGMGVSEKKIYLTPNAVEDELFSQNISGIEIRNKFDLKDLFVIGFVGGFYPWHGLPFLLQAVKNLGKDNLCLLLVGDGPMKEELKKIAVELNIRARLTFCGFVESKTLPAYIMAMDICVMPDSNNYGSPMKIFEYMAMGKPVVAPRLGPIEEVIEDGKNGLLFDQGDINGITSCLNRLINDRELYDNISLNAKEKIFKNHLWKHNAEQIIMAYRKVKLTKSK